MGEFTQKTLKMAIIALYFRNLRPAAARRGNGEWEKAERGVGDRERWCFPGR